MSTRFATAAYDGNTELVATLLQDPRVDPAEMDNYAIRWAANHGHTAVVALLLQDPRVNPTARYDSALHSAIQNRYTEIVKLLLSHPLVDPAANYNSAIQRAVLSNSPDTLHLLLQDPRVDPTIVNNKPIRMAAKSGYTSIVKLLLQDERVDPTAKNSETIRLAARYGHIYIVALLLQDGRADPTAHNHVALIDSAHRIAAATDTYYQIVYLLLEDSRTWTAAKPPKITKEIMKVLTDQQRITTWAVRAFQHKWTSMSNTQLYEPSLKYIIEQYLPIRFSVHATNPQIRTQFSRYIKVIWDAGVPYDDDVLTRHI